MSLWAFQLVDGLEVEQVTDHVDPRSAVPPSMSVRPCDLDGLPVELRLSNETFPGCLCPAPPAAPCRHGQPRGVCSAFGELLCTSWFALGTPDSCVSTTSGRCAT